MKRARAWVIPDDDCDEDCDEDCDNVEALYDTDADEEEAIVKSILEARESLQGGEASKPVERRGSKKGHRKRKNDCNNSEFARMLRENHDVMLHV